MPLPLTAREEDVQVISRRLDRIRGRIARACQRAGRGAEEITLVGVTKTHPVQLVAAAIAAGLHDLGENKAQELNAKAAGLPDDVCRWHMIGHLQRNKAKIVVRHAALFHALDSMRLAVSLERAAALMGRVLPCLLQVNVSRETSKFGVAPSAVPAMLEAVAQHEHLDIKGLMTLASPAADPEEVRPQFQQMRRLLESAPLSNMTVLSMGMSGDFEVAIEEGATHIRVGTAIFGPRNVDRKPQY